MVIRELFPDIASGRLILADGTPVDIVLATIGDGKLGEARDRTGKDRLFNPDAPGSSKVFDGHWGGVDQ